jgi:hypothetical protein
MTSLRTAGDTTNTATALDTYKVNY